MSVNVPRRGPRTRRGRRWRPCRPSRPSPRRRASRRSTSRRCCWWVEGEEGGSATASLGTRGTRDGDRVVDRLHAEHCASVASRELDTRAIGRRFGGRGRQRAGPSETRGRPAVRRASCARPPSRTLASVSRPPRPRVAGAGALASVLRSIGRASSERMCVGFPAGNADAPLVGAHGGALRDEGVGGGEASHLYGA